MIYYYVLDGNFVLFADDASIFESHRNINSARLDIDKLLGFNMDSGLVLNVHIESMCTRLSTVIVLY